MEQGYYFTFISLAALLAVYFFVLVPGFVDRLAAYWCALACFLVAIYFLVASIVFWVRRGGMNLSMPS